jgi:hypothetical protein
MQVKCDLIGLGEISQFGRFFCPWSHFLEKYRQNHLGAIVFKNAKISPEPQVNAIFDFKLPNFDNEFFGVKNPIL